MIGGDYSHALEMSADNSWAGESSSRSVPCFCAARCRARQALPCRAHCRNSCSERAHVHVPGSCCRPF